MAKCLSMVASRLALSRRSSVTSFLQIKYRVQQQNPSIAYSTLTPFEASAILRAQEAESDSEMVVPPVKSFDRNVLASNFPIEDCHAEGLIGNGSRDGAGMMFGVFDGHGGEACAQAVSKRIFSYVMAALLDLDELEQHYMIMEAIRKDKSRELHEVGLVKTMMDEYNFEPSLQALYDESYMNYVKDLIETHQYRTDHTIADRMQYAFVALDDDISDEVERGANRPDLRDMTRTVASSGCVAAVTLVRGNDIYVASSGDCNVVLGTLSENDTWVAKNLTTEHNTANIAEVERILSEHPGEQERDIIRGDRLLGMLAPLRAFGDFRFKWPAEKIEEHLGEMLGDNAVAQNYLTPPYLTAMPEVRHHKLTPRDRFMVIASDGLWDMMTPMQVIRLVGEHLSGKVTLKPVQVGEQQQITLAEISRILKQRQQAMKLKPTDINAATHLIRHALGGSVYGIDHAKLSRALDLPQDMRRMFRDDITITVVYFDLDFLRAI